MTPPSNTTTAATTNASNGTKSPWILLLLALKIMFPGSDPNKRKSTADPRQQRRNPYARRSNANVAFASGTDGLMEPPVVLLLRCLRRRYRLHLLLMNVLQVYRHLFFNRLSPLLTRGHFDRCHRNLYNTLDGRRHSNDLE